MAIVAFKPMKGYWKTLLGGIQYDKDNNDFELKIDSPDHKEQIHIVMNMSEARIQARYAIYAMIDSGNLKYIKECIKEHSEMKKFEDEKN